MIIKKADYVISCVKKEQYPNNTLPEFVFMGRSNVGKSSFINALTNRKNLAYTSSKPGKTLTLNFYNINDAFYFVDVPGYGYAARTIGHRLEFGEMIEEYLASSTCLKKCFLVIDSRHAPTEDDCLMYDFLVYNHIDVCIIATKCDKLKMSELNKSLKTIKETLNLSDETQVIMVSSLNKKGIDEVQNLIETYL